MLECAPRGPPNYRKTVYFAPRISSGPRNVVRMRNRYASPRETVHFRRNASGRERFVAKTRRSNGHRAHDGDVLFTRGLLFTELGRKSLYPCAFDLTNVKSDTLPNIIFTGIRIRDRCLYHSARNHIGERSSMNFFSNRRASVECLSRHGI